MTDEIAIDIIEKKFREHITLNYIVLKRLNELRGGVKLLQAKLGIAQPLITRYETGEHLPTIELLIKYADYFGVSMDFLIGRADVRKENSINVSRRN